MLSLYIDLFKKLYCNTILYIYFYGDKNRGRAVIKEYNEEKREKKKYFLNK